VPWGTEIWRATQLLALHQIMDRPGDIDRDNIIPLAAKARWGVDAEVSDEERSRVLERLKALVGNQAALPERNTTAGEFAVAVAKLLISSSRP